MNPDEETDDFIPTEEEYLLTPEYTYWRFPMPEQEHVLLAETHMCSQT